MVILEISVQQQRCERRGRREVDEAGSALGGPRGVGLHASTGMIPSVSFLNLTNYFPGSGVIVVTVRYTMSATSTIGKARNERWMHREREWLLEKSPARSARLTRAMTLRSC